MSKHERPDRDEPPSPAEPLFRRRKTANVRRKPLARLAVIGAALVLVPCAFLVGFTAANDQPEYAPESSAPRSSMGPEAEFGQQKEDFFAYVQHTAEQRERRLNEPLRALQQSRRLPHGNRFTRFLDRLADALRTLVKE